MRARKKEGNLQIGNQPELSLEEGGKSPTLVIDLVEMIARDGEAHYVRGIAEFIRPRASPPPQSYVKCMRIILVLELIFIHTRFEDPMPWSRILNLT